MIHVLCWNSPSFLTITFLIFYAPLNISDTLRHWLNLSFMRMSTRYAVILSHYFDRGERSKSFLVFNMYLNFFRFRLQAGMAHRLGLVYLEKIYYLVSYVSCGILWNKLTPLKKFCMLDSYNDCNIVVWQVCSRYWIRRLCTHTHVNFLDYRIDLHIQR